MLKGKTPLTICFLLAAVFSTGLSYAQMTRISVGYSAISGDALPAWLAKDTGIFEKNGLDVQLVFFTGGTTAVMALVSADTPIAQLAGRGRDQFRHGWLRCRADCRWRDLAQLLFAGPPGNQNPRATQRRHGGDQSLRLVV